MGNKKNYGLGRDTYHNKRFGGYKIGSKTLIKKSKLKGFTGKNKIGAG